jgi:lysophospholipase L1-like esterase
MTRPVMSVPCARLRLGATALILLLATVTLPGTASAAPAAPVRGDVVALGDSFSAGVGTGSYDLAGSPCRRSSHAYGPLWAGRHDARLTFLACSGAKMNEVLRKQVPKVPREAGLILITMGGNDTGFMPVLSVCTLTSDDSTCRKAVRLGEAAAMTAVPVQLTAALALLRDRAPQADIVVLGYPRLFEEGPCTVPFAPSAYRRALLNDGVDLLNDTLRRFTKAMGARFIDVDARFAGHGICASDGQPWINPPGHGSDSYHPTRRGYERGYLAALAAQVR